MPHIIQQFNTYNFTNFICCKKSCKCIYLPRYDHKQS